MIAVLEENILLQMRAAGNVFEIKRDLGRTTEDIDLGFLREIVGTAGIRDGFENG